jgi:hypothetical protein
MKRTFLATLFAGVLAIAGYAVAQVTLPPLTPVNQNDYVQIIKGGVGTAQSVYAPAGMVGAQYEYTYLVPVTSFNIVAGNIGYLYLNPAGTLAAGTLTLPANPGDGQGFCLQDTQTQTAITIQAATGQALASFGVATPTALVAGTIYCWFFDKTLGVWIETR